MSAFIAVEGPNGVGKSTVIALTGELLADHGVPVHVTKEPSTTLLGAAIRELEPSLPREALALACAADRHDHLVREIEPALSDGKLVLSDRYVPSSLVLQRLDGLEIDYIWSLSEDVRPPDLTIYLEDDPSTIDERIASRTGTRRFERPGTAARELALYSEARDFLADRGWAQEVIDQAGRPARDVAAELAGAIRALLERGAPA